MNDSDHGLALDLLGETCGFVFRSCLTKRVCVHAAIEGIRMDSCGLQCSCILFRFYVGFGITPAGNPTRSPVDAGRILMLRLGTTRSIEEP